MAGTDPPPLRHQKAGANASGSKAQLPAQENADASATSFDAATLLPTDGADAVSTSAAAEEDADVRDKEANTDPSNPGADAEAEAASAGPADEAAVPPPEATEVAGAEADPGSEEIGPQIEALGGDTGSELELDMDVELEVGPDPLAAGGSVGGGGGGGIGPGEHLGQMVPEEGKRVKVYELRDQAWFDRGTGQCKGIYDDAQDLALLVVESEEDRDETELEHEGEGGFLKEELLLSSKVEKEDIYARQQEPGGLDVALSFQDAEGCEDIWQFIMEVQRHLNNLPKINIPASSSPLSASPMLGMAGTAGVLDRMPWQLPSLGNIREQFQSLQIQTRSQPGRERAIEHILSEDYVKSLILVFDQAEDLESLEDLHTLCSIMQTIIMMNDNGILEYILQDDVFEGVIGMLEYDHEYPSLKASFRQFFREISRFRQVVEIRDPAIRSKIHQTYRLQYLKEVVLARLLDDPTFGILNGFIFFNQVDIIGHIHQNDTFLTELFAAFQGQSQSDEAQLDSDRRRDTVLFLHQLMLMGKSIQMPTRLALYRNLLDRGLLTVLEWAFTRTEPPVVHAAAEMLTLVTEHDVITVRGFIVRDNEAKKTTLLSGLIRLFGSSHNLGLVSQLTDTLRTLLEPPAESDAQTVAARRDANVSENFISYFYDSCCADLFQPLVDLPDFAPDTTAHLDRRQTAVTHHLVELLYFCVMLHANRSSFYVLSNPINSKVVKLLYLRDKPLRLVVTRFIKCCIKTSNHFLHRSIVKNDLLRPLVVMLEQESRRDNMLTSAGMQVLDDVRKDNIKPVINYLFDNYRARLDVLSQRPYFRASIQALHARWEQINEPPPPPPPPSDLEGTRADREKGQEDYFNGSDDEAEVLPSPGTSVKRKRVPANTPNKRKASPQGAGAGAGPRRPALGLDYDDGSDSDSAGGSPRAGPSRVAAAEGSGESGTGAALKPTAELAEDLGDVASRMRAKRQREEDEDEGEGFAGLLSRAKHVAGAPAVETESDGVKQEEEGGGVGAGGAGAGKGNVTPKKKGFSMGFGGGGGGGGGERRDTPRKDPMLGVVGGDGAGQETKVKLSWGRALKKLGGGGGGGGKKSPTLPSASAQAQAQATAAAGGAEGAGDDEMKG